ncbi:MAG: hypothetical protein ACKVIR_06490 [Candidatus Poseidoniales archaeon]
MISSGTLHVISTELVVGMFALAGISFLMCALDKGPEARESIAHWALLGGLLATPLAIITGVNAAPGDGLDNPLLANKLLLSMTATGLSLGLIIKWKRGAAIDRIHAGIGMIATGLIMTTASIGGEFSRGETLLFFLPKEIVFLFPKWASIIILILGLILIVKSTIQHRVRAGTSIS